MISAMRRYAGAAAIAVGAVCTITATVPVARADPGPPTLTRPTGYVFTGPTSLSDCTAFGQQQVASGNWDGYSCKKDPTIPDPTAYRAWVIIWVGCPTC